MMRFLSIVALSLLAAICLPPENLRAQDARAWSSADTVSVGDRFHLSLVVRHDPRAIALVPDPARGDSVLGDLELLAMERHSGTALRGEGVVDSLVYTVTTFALDSALVPPLRIPVVAEADTAVTETNPVFVAVRSLVPADADDVQDLAPIVPFSRNWWPWILAAALLAALVAAYLIYRRRRKSVGPPAAVRPPESPYEEAIRRLQTLETLPLSSSDEIKYFYVEMSDALRMYIERRFGYPALESTTRELMELLEQAAVDEFPSSEVLRIRGILHGADMVKFADFRPGEEAARRAASDTRLAVEEIEKDARTTEARVVVQEA